MIGNGGSFYFKVTLKNLGEDPDSRGHSNRGLTVPIFACFLKYKCFSDQTRLLVIFEP